jgi:gamma-glutamyltranspeptidase/glutathione hydrolase
VQAWSGSVRVIAANLTRRRRLGPAIGALLALAAAPGCSGVDSLIPRLATTAGPQAGQPGFVRGFLGGVAAEEPRAALVARDVLSAGGSATDAAVAAGFTLAVTLPSRAGLGGGGACLVFEPRRGPPEAVLFPPGPRTAAIPAGTDRPAAVPMLARGLFALHTRGGRRPFEELIAEAERLARLGTPVSRALAQDLAAVRSPLLADPGARAVFARADGAPLAEGDRLEQPDLATTLATMRVSGVGDLYQGALARRLETTSERAGGGLNAEELRAGLAQVVTAPQLRVGNDLVAFLPAAGEAWQRGGGNPAQILAAAGGGARGGPPVGASTGLVTLDREGGAVACAFTMNNLFGTGRVAQGMGVLLAAAPGQGAVAPVPLAAVLASNASLRAFRAAVAGSGQQAAPPAVAAVMAQILLGAAPEQAIAAAAPEPARVVAISCPRYLPGRPEACSAAADPRGAGIGLAGAER